MGRSWSGNKAGRCHRKFNRAIELWEGKVPAEPSSSFSGRISARRSTSRDRGHLERHAAGNDQYPALTQGHDGTLHAIYSCFIASDAPVVVKPGKKRKGPRIVAKGIKHAAFNEAWIRLGD
jgi:hypothetical protein